MLTVIMTVMAVKQMENLKKILHMLAAADKVEMLARAIANLNLKYQEQKLRKLAQFLKEYRVRAFEFILLSSFRINTHKEHNMNRDIENSSIVNTVKLKV
jgi:hypothetical protein